MAQALTVESRAEVLSRPGAIILARHGEPAISRAVRLTAAEYGAFWTSYEASGIAPGQTPPDGLIEIAAGAGVVLSSTRRRSIESAQAVAAGRVLAPDLMFVEAPLPAPSWPSWVRMSPKGWGFVVRVLWWFFNHHDDMESRAQAEARAEAAAKRLAELAANGQDVVLLAHGFFNFMIGQALKRRGWRVAASEGFKYWSTRRFERK